MLITLEIQTPSRCEFIDITDRVREAVVRHGLKHGVCHLFVPHTTAGLTINEGADPGVARDILDLLERLAPRGSTYHHGEENAPAHLKASLMGSSVTILVEGGELALGRWQAIFLCEFDGPRKRKILVELPGG